MTAARTDVERAGITAWLGPAHPALNILGKVGPDLHPDSLAHHPRFRAMVTAVSAAVLREAAEEWDKVAAQYGAASTANLGQEFDQQRQAQRATHMAEWLRHRANAIEQETAK